MANTLARQHLHRRHYTIEDPALDRARRIELLVKVDGKVIVHVQAREPGLVAFVSRPEDQGFDIEIVQVGQQFVDVELPPGVSPEPVAEWQYTALGL